MAVVLTGFTAAFTRVPFVKPPDLQRMYTSLPRARVDFVVQDGVIPLKPVNDQQNVQVGVDLPTTFAYRMISSMIAVRQDQAFAWDAFGQLIITNAMRGQPLGQDNRHLIASENTREFTTSLSERLYFTNNDTAMPTYILQSLRTNVAPVVDFRLTNTDAVAAGAGVLNFFASFFEYDIEQTEAFPVHYAALTLDR